MNDTYLNTNTTLIIKNVLSYLYGSLENNNLKEIKISDYNSSNPRILNVLGDNNSMFEIKVIEGENFSLLFYKPLLINYYTDDDGFYCDMEELDIHSYGSTLEELKESFQEDIAIAWDLYVDCDEEELSDGAKELRVKLLSLLKRI